MLRHDYSLPERALSFWYPLTLGILAVTSLGLRYVTNPVTCWTPAHFTRAHMNYAQDVCFQKTEIYPVMLEVPSVRDAVPKPHYTYHQWVPFTLGMSAILCLIPHVIWRMLSGLLWMDTHALAQTLADNQRHNVATRHVMLKDSALVVQAGLKGGNWMLTAAALGRKMAVCLVCVLQLVLIVVLFRPQLSAEGEPEEKQEEGQMPDDEKGKHNFSKMIALPEQFTCLYDIRLLTNAHKYSIQCTMPVSQVYSKGFTFLFYLFLVLAVCCVLDLLTFLPRLAIPGLRDASLRRYLAVTDPASDPQVSAVLQRFLDSLGMDGRLVVAVTADVCGPVAAADLTHHLWMIFKASPRPGPLAADPVHGPAPAGPVSTIPPPAAAATAPSGPASADPDMYPLLPVGGRTEGMKGTEA